MLPSRVRFEETLRYPKIMPFGAMIFALVALGIGAAAWICPEMMDRRQVPILRTVIPAIGILLGWLALDFDALRTRVTDAQVRVGFRWASRTIARSSIRAARVVDYRPMQYGGWGLKWNPFTGRTAYSVFEPKAVEIEYATPSGQVKTICVSSKQPERLVEAIRAERLEG